jgi:hypothetical protein
MVPELKDTFKEDTVKAYSEWLRLEGQMEDIRNISLSKLSINLTVPHIPILTFALLLAEAYEENPSVQSNETAIQHHQCSGQVMLGM